MLCTLGRFDFSFEFGLPLSRRNPATLFHQTFINMDPKKEDNKFKKLPPDQQLDILIRYRDKCLKDDDRFISAYDNFVSNVMDYGLGQTWIDGMSNGRV